MKLVEAGNFKTRDCVDFIPEKEKERGRDVGTIYFRVKPNDRFFKNQLTYINTT